MQLYKNNACALLSRIMSILNLDWLKQARSVRGVYEYYIFNSGALVNSCTAILCLRNLGILYITKITINFFSMACE